MADNYFLLKPDEYQRSLQPIQDWLQQTAWYASKELNKPYESCLTHLKKKLNDKSIPLSDPTVVFFHREENGDRHRKTASLRSYIQKALTDSNIIVPTFTTYLPPQVIESPIVGYLDDNVKVRKVYKKKAQELEALGDKTGYLFYNTRQDNAKRANNSVSGGFVAEGSIIQNRTGHSTLTSITRSIASLSNASNERLVEGNRHYYTPQITLNNIISVCSSSNLELIDNVIRVFGLVYPTAQQTADAIFRSYQLYCRDTRAFKKIEDFIHKLSPTELAAITYTGDLYHIRELNPGFMRIFLSRLSCLETTPIINITQHKEQQHRLSTDPIGYIHSTDEQIVNFAHQVNITIMRGKGKKYEKLNRDEQLKLASSCYNIEQTVLYYKDFLKAFFLTKNSPCTIATIQHQIRRSVVLSDTDSTMFSVDSWVEWYFGSIGFEDQHFAVAGAVMYMATQAIAHILALFSANMGVEKKRLFTLAMKPEFGFPVFAQTSVAKHYYTARLIKEGNVYNDIEMEIKGVHHIDSTVPVNIIKHAAEVMEEKIRAVMRGEKLSLHKALTQAGDVERDIISSIRKGETKYLKKTKIKERNAYKQESDGSTDKTPYRFYACWEMCFAKKYGSYGAPPYQAVRIPLNLPNPSAVKNWLDRLPDQTFANNFRNWMVMAGMNKIQLLPIPMAFTESHGIPDELISIVDDKRIVLSLTRSFRNIVESHGFFPKNDLLITEMGY